jgi:transposase
MANHHSTEEKAIALGMHEAGKTTSEVSRATGINVHTLKSIWAKYRREGTVVTKKRSGRPPKIDARTLHRIKRVVQSQPRMTVSQIGVELDIRVTHKTMAKYLNRLGFSSRIACRKPMLLKKNAVKRLRFANLHKNWSVAQWKSVFFTDESSFELGNFSSQIRETESSTDYLETDWYTIHPAKPVSHF